MVRVARYYTRVCVCVCVVPLTAGYHVARTGKKKQIQGFGVKV